MNAEQEKALYQIAEDRGGYFSIAQASSIGIRRNQIYRAIRQGTIEKAYHGVYRLVLFPASRFEEIYAAMVSLGENAVVGYETALYIYDLSDVIPNEIHFILPRSSSRRRNHIRMHTAALPPEDITSFEGFQITTVSRTIIDILSTHGDFDQIRLAVSQALDRGLTTHEKLIQQAKQRSEKTTKLILELIDQKD